MELKYFPSIKKIQIKNFSLYPGDLNFSYDFIQGINLIIGGNGVGKTTFLNILKFALIGLYKKGLDTKRREYKGIEYRYDKRINLPYKFFSNRMDDVEYKLLAEVTLTFSLNRTLFEVTRDLYSPSVKKVFVTDLESGEEIKLDGIIVNQYDFDMLFSDKLKNQRDLEDTLQWKYEEAVAKASNYEFFDNLIFFVNEILFFSESRKTIMWDGIVQNRLAGKYFIDPMLDNKKESAERDAKYQDSLARHKSEDIRAINKIIDTISDKDSNNKQFKDLILELEIEKKNVEIYFNELERIQKERDQSEIKSSKLHSEKNRYSKNLEGLEQQKRKEEELIFSSLFRKVTPKYHDYLSFLKVSGDCPLCNNELPSLLLDKIKNDDAHCMMCSSPIQNPQIVSENLILIRENITETLQNIRNKEKEIIIEDDNLKKLDNRFRDTKLKLNTFQSKVRKLEFAVQQLNNNTNSKTDSEFKAINAQIDELEKQKELAQVASRKALKEAQKIIEQTNLQRLETREKLSGIFNQFGSEFLGVPCELVYEDPKDGYGKRYLPRINGIDRLYEEELSESQRFFIDQSFRMSLLHFFNTTSSFFMCETPDSSLDISYEKNAAKVFLEYIKQPNELIITSNLNNSEFLEYLIEQAKPNAINYVNLLKIGKQSMIQSNSSELLKASNKIEQIIDGKRKRHKSIPDLH